MVSNSNINHINDNSHSTTIMNMNTVPIVNQQQQVQQQMDQQQFFFATIVK